MPIDASIPLSGIAPKITSPAQLMSLRDLAAQTRMRESELDYLPKKRRMAEQQFDLEADATRAKIASQRYATEWERQQKDDEFRKGVRNKGLNTILVGKGSGYADNVIENNMRTAMLADLEEAKRTGKLSLLGVDDAEYERRKAAIMNATVDQIMASQLTQEQALEQSQYPAAGGQQGAPQAQGMPMSQIGAPADPDVLSDAGASALINDDFNPYPEPQEGALPSEQAAVNDYLKILRPGMEAAPTEGAVSMQDVSRGKIEPQAPWERLRTEADDVEDLGGKVNYERAKDMRAEADRLEDNDRDERKLNATIADRKEKEDARIQAAQFKQNDQENKLSDDFMKASKIFIDTKDAYTRIAVSAQDSSAAGDLSMIFNYMKMLDPGSTVREGEFATAQNSAGVGDRVRAWYNRVMTGERLSETQRLDFLDRAERLYQGMLKNHESIEKQFRERAKRSNVNPDNVIIDLRPQNLPPIWTPAKAERLRKLEEMERKEKQNGTDS